MAELDATPVKSTFQAPNRMASIPRSREIGSLDKTVRLEPTVPTRLSSTDSGHWSICRFVTLWERSVCGSWVQWRGWARVAPPPPAATTVWKYPGHDQRGTCRVAQSPMCWWRPRSAGEGRLPAAPGRAGSRAHVAGTRGERRLPRITMSVSVEVYQRGDCCHCSVFCLLHPYIYTYILHSHWLCRLPWVQLH